VAPLTDKVVELPEQMLALKGVTVRFKAGLKLTVTAAVAVPHVPMAITETVPADEPKLMVMAFEPEPEVILAPAGTVHV